jgi:hypothetical protein
MHLTYTEIKLSQIYSTNKYRFKIPDGAELDDLFFYSVPTSLFAVDDRIPAILRQLLTEAEGCLKSNFLTGASACARKLVYELARRESAEGSDYEERIKSLKAKRPDVDGTYFDNLVAIQRVTSEKVHENSYDGWSGKHLRLILASLHEILYEMYALPEIKKARREQLLKLKSEILNVHSDQPVQPEEPKKAGGDR